MLDLLPVLSIDEITMIFNEISTIVYRSMLNVHEHRHSMYVLMNESFRRNGEHELDHDLVVDYQLNCLTNVLENRVSHLMLCQL
jgi:hypothetical protein